jgi:hypothetical protein
MEENTTKKLVKPFTVGVTVEHKEENNEPEPEKKLEKPFIIHTELLEQPTKLYLILKTYIRGDGFENSRDWEFFTGTTQDLYDYLVEEILDDTPGISLDVMKSRVLVDSPNIKISHKCSIYTFMKDTLTTGKVVNTNGNFDIQDYYYQDEEDEEDTNG